MSALKNRKAKGLQVHIVEPHNDVVRPIHRAVASHLLPFSRTAMIHLDSHPDLLIPVHMPADIVYKPTELYDALSIENWLLPLVFAKHFDYIVWVKPPWARQFSVATHKFLVGRCSQTDTIRVTSKENYFLTDGLYRKVDDLHDSQELTLQVEEVVPTNWVELDERYKPPAKSSTDSDISWMKKLQDHVQDKPYILDIDLDFFSTANPFKNFLDPEAEEALKRLYHYESPKDSCDETVTSFTQMREEQLNLLERVFTELEEERLKYDDEKSSLDDAPFDSEHNIPESFAEILRDVQDELEKNKIDDLVLLCHTLLKHNQVNVKEPKTSSSSELSNATKSSNSNSDLTCTSHNSCLSLQTNDNTKSFSCDMSDKELNEGSTHHSINPKTASPESRSVKLTCEQNKLPEITTQPNTDIVNLLNTSAITNTERIQTLNVTNGSTSCSNTIFDSNHVQQQDLNVRNIPLTFDQLHDFGCTLDDTELPHHISTPEQVAALQAEVKVMLQSLPCPAIVTIARSSLDGYCPKTEVDRYEIDTLKMLEDLFGNLVVTKHYDI